MNRTAKKTLIRTWDHWIVWNITPRERVDENSVPGNEGTVFFGDSHMVVHVLLKLLIGIFFQGLRLGYDADSWIRFEKKMMLRPLFKIMCLARAGKNHTPLQEIQVKARDERMGSQ